MTLTFCLGVFVGLVTLRSCVAAGGRAGLAAVVVLVGGLGVVPAAAGAATFGPQTTLPFSGLSNPYGVAVDGSGDVFVADTRNNRVEELSPGADGKLADGTQTTLPFNGLNSPVGIAVDRSGDVFVADLNRIRVVELSPGADGKLADGTQTTLPFTGLTYPQGVAVDASGDVFVVDTNTDRVLELSPGADGKLSGGTQTTLPFTGLYFPQAVAVDRSGDVIVTTNSGMVELSPGADGKLADGTQTTLPHPTGWAYGLAVDPSGDLFVTEGSPNLVEELSPGPDGKLSDGTGTNLPFTGLNLPQGAAADAFGDLFVADTFNDQIVELPAVLSTPSLSPAGQHVVPGDTGDFAAEGFDASGNDLGDVTARTKFSITPDGSGSAAGAQCLANGCLATTAGTYTVTGRIGYASGSTTMIVVAGMPTSLSLSPSIQSVASGVSQVYQAEAFDSYGNDAGDVTASTSFSIAPSGGTGSQTGASCSGDSCSATVPGAYIVSAIDTQARLATGTASLTVIAPPVATSTSVDCGSAKVVAGTPVTCTATVTDTSSSPSNPTGIVRFSSTSSKATVSGSPCALAAVNGSSSSSSCQISYTPGGTNSTVTGHYRGDSGHNGSHGSAKVKVSLRPTKTTLSCDQSSLAPGSSTTCTATVLDTGSGQTKTPTGQVMFSGNKTDSFSNANPCRLTPINSQTSSCTTTYTPSAGPNTHNITARYTGAGTHAGSNSSTPITVT
jgi:hypothetical protein